jgi:hypothetical protein
MQQTRAVIEVGGQMVAMIVAAHFYLAPPDPNEETARAQRLAGEYDIDPEKLLAAMRETPVLDELKGAQLCGWLRSVAHTFGEMGRERAEITGRLRAIAAMSTIEL